ncbi:MAG: glyoxalase [Lachnospiraceae bacterium]|nr:glyoxalase [Lachnospiraceae bacterium]
MPEFDDAVLDAFLEQQLNLYPEKVAQTREEARDFLEESFAVVVSGKQEVLDYFEEEGIDAGGAGVEDITEADEVFDVGDGRYLIVEG